MKEIQAILQQLEKKPVVPRALATLVKVEGSSYRRVGARLLVDAKGNSLGSISGGCLEADVIARARSVIKTGVSQVAVYNTMDENDLVWGTGTGCNGVVHIFIEKISMHPAWAKTIKQNLTTRQTTPLKIVWDSTEVKLQGTHTPAELPKRLPPKTQIFTDNIEPPVRLLIFGAGDDVKPLVNLAHELGWWVELADARAGLATAKRFPQANKTSVTPPTSAAATLTLDPWTVAVIMTHRYRDDVELLKALLPKELPYLGLLGPKKRADKILAELASTKFKVSAKMLTKFHAPVGLDVGGDGPAAVALAMLAEIQAVLAGRNARPLRERVRPIHT